MTSPLHVLLVTVAWPQAGGHNLYTDLMEEFRDNGHRVTVVCAHERRYGGTTKVTEEHGAQVLRVTSGNLQSTNRVEKTVSAALLGTQMHRAIRKHLADARFDLILCSTPPITLAGLIGALKREHGAGCYLLLKDIWPQTAVDLGAMRSVGLAWRYFRHYEKLMYRTADFIGCMSPANVAYLLRHNPDLEPKRVDVCPNSERPRPVRQVDRRAVLTRFGIPSHATVFVFGGNLGKPQGVTFLLDAIEALEERQDIFFLIVGSGTEHQMLSKRLERMDSSNARLYERLPRDDYEALLAACDVGLILLDARFTVPNFPSRLLAYLQNSKAVLAAVDQATDLGDIVAAEGCGISVKHGDLGSFISAVNKLAASAETRREMGQRGRILFEREYTAATSYRIVMSHFESGVAAHV